MTYHRSGKKPRLTEFRSSPRRIVNLRLAWLCSEGPPGLAKLTRGRDCKSAVKKGLSYERRALRYIRSLDLPGQFYEKQWIAFRDENGRGWAQPDGFIVMADLVLVLEMKLTQTFTAVDQIKFLYKPLLEKIYSLPVLGLQVCKGLRHMDQYMVLHPSELLLSRSPMIHTMHVI